MSHLAEEHSYACKSGIDPNKETIDCGVASCPNFMYKDDLEIIKSEWKKRGIELSDNQADELWGLYSESVCAGWIGINKDGDKSWVWNVTKPFINEVLGKGN